MKLSEMSLMMVSLCTVDDYFFEPRRNNTTWAFRGMGTFTELLHSVPPYYLSSFFKINSKTTFQKFILSPKFVDGYQTFSKTGICKLSCKWFKNLIKLHEHVCPSLNNLDAIDNATKLDAVSDLSASIF